MTDFLEQVVAERRRDVEAARAEITEIDLQHHALDNMWIRLRSGWPQGPATWRGWLAMNQRGTYGDAFTSSLRGRRDEGQLAVIAEVKRVSPALGPIATSVDPAEQALRYAIAGASAISVLTEPRHWGGSLSDLAAVRETVPDLPILCKDVIVSTYQIDEARKAGADAVLLIAEALSDDELRRFAAHARTMNMGALVEAHEPVAFGRAVASRALVVGANARDLRHPQDIDPGRARQLHTFVREEQIFVAESGINSVDDARLLPSRVDAVLVGTAFMRAADPTPLIQALAGVRRTGAHARTRVELR